MFVVDPKIAIIMMAALGGSYIVFFVSVRLLKKDWARARSLMRSDIDTFRKGLERLGN